MELLVSMPDHSLLRLSFSDLLAQTPYTVLYFYPKDNTPGCSLEAQDFNNFLPEFARLGAQILGVSKDSHRSHCNFIGKYDLLFPLISDPEWVLHKQFGAVGEKSLYGRKYMGTIRSTYLLNQQGTILHQWNDVKVQGHVQSVLDTLSSLV